MACPPERSRRLTGRARPAIRSGTSQQHAFVIWILADVLAEALLVTGPRPERSRRARPQPQPPAAPSPCRRPRPARACPARSLPAPPDALPAAGGTCGGHHDALESLRVPSVAAPYLAMLRWVLLRACQLSQPLSAARLHVMLPAQWRRPATVRPGCRLQGGGLRPVFLPVHDVYKSCAGSGCDTHVSLQSYCEPRRSNCCWTLSVNAVCSQQKLLRLC